MSDKTDAVVGALGDKALQYLNGLETLTKQYAPDVLNATLQVVQIEALSCIAWGLVGVGVALLLWKLWPHYWAECEEGYSGNVVIQVGGGASGFFAVLFALINISRFFDVWMWAALISPKLYIAHKVFEKLL